MAKDSSSDKKSGDMRKQAGAGPSMAAHSKDAKSTAKSGQSTKASSKKS